MPFKELPEGTTHSKNDGYGMPEHNSVNEVKNKILEEFENELNLHACPHEKESLKSFLSTALDSYTREITEAMIPEEDMYSDNPKRNYRIIQNT